MHTFSEFEVFLTRYHPTNMDQIEAALQDLKLQDTKNISATAKQYGVQRSTLSRRFHRITNSAQAKHQEQQLLNDQQEQDLVNYINKLTEKGLPPTVSMLRNFARDIASREPSKTWSQRFCKKY